MNQADVAPEKSPNPAADFRFPKDRRLRLWVRRRELIIGLVLAFGPPVVAWGYYLLFGLPTNIVVAEPTGPHAPHGFPLWDRLSLSALMDRVRPLPAVKYVVFRSFGEGIEPGESYEAHNMNDARHPQSLLAFEMNYGPLSEMHGAPLRLRVENQLGYKMVKWIKSIEFVADLSAVGKGYEGKNEDEEHFDLIANL